MRDDGQLQKSPRDFAGRLNRREVAAAGLALSVAAVAFPAAALSMTPNGADLMPDPMSRSPFAEPLIRIGETAIAVENDAALDAYFAPDFRFHGSGGDVTYEQLKAYFASLRAAFTGLQVRRAAIIGEGSYLACRTEFSGTFTRAFTRSPVGLLQPNGRHVAWEVMNMFRFGIDGLLAEEWAQSDSRILLQKLGAT